MANVNVTADMQDVLKRTFEQALGRVAADVIEKYSQAVRNEFMKESRKVFASWAMTVGGDVNFKTDELSFSVTVTVPKIDFMESRHGALKRMGLR